MKAIYIIKNLTTGKLYIGSAQVVKRRWRKHRESLRRGDHCNKYLQNAWDKYGEEDFKFEILEEVFKDEDLLSSEQKWLDKALAFKRELGYNICPNAGSPLGRKVTAQTRQKISQATSGENHHFWGKTLTEEHRKKIGNSNKGKRAWNKGRKSTEEERRAMSERVKGEKHPNWGKERPADVRKKISNRLLGHEVSATTREKLRKANLGKKHSEATKEKLRQANRRANRNRSNLTIEDAREIRRLCSEGQLNQGEIGALFGISQATVSAIKHNRLWKE